MTKMYSIFDKQVDHEPDPTSAKATRHPLLRISSIFVWSFIVTVDMTCLAVALPLIATKLHASDVQIYWAGTSFVVCSAVSQPLFSAISDAIGRKPVIHGSLLVFTVGSIICAIAKNITTLIVGRSVQGIGASGLLVLCYILLADLFDIKDRAYYQSIVAITWLVGAVVGPIMAGGFAYDVSWPWIFWFNLPFCAIAWVLSILFLDLPVRDTKASRGGLLYIDWFGAALFAGSLTSFLVAISWGGIMFSWTSWQTLLPLILGIVGLVAWMLYSEYISKNPLIPLKIITNRTAAINYYGTFVHGFLQFGITYYLPLYYQGVKGYSALISGVAGLPQCSTAGPSASIAGMFINKTRRVKIFTLIGWAIFAFGLGLLQLLDENTSVPAWIFINVPSGIGLGIGLSSIAIATQNSAERSGTNEEVAEIRSMAATLNPFFRVLGQAVAIAAGQAAVSNQIKQRLGEQYANEAAGIAPLVKTLAPELQVVVRSAFVGSLRVVWWILTALALSAGVLVFFTADQRISETPANDVEIVLDDKKGDAVDSPWADTGVFDKKHYAVEITALDATEK